MQLWDAMRGGGHLQGALRPVAMPKGHSLAVSLTGLITLLLETASYYGASDGKHCTMYYVVDLIIARDNEF